MRIRQKYYPYPVMERTGHSYKDFSFNVVTTVKREGYNIVFSFDASIEDKQILDLIQTGKAVFAYHVQCAQTCYRAAFETKEKLYTKTIKEEEERLAARRKAIENNRERLKDYLQNCMIATNKLKFKTAMHSFGIQKNPQSVRLIEGEKIPDIYLIPQEPKVDKRAILADLKAGKELRFACLEQTESLRIR